MSRLHLYIFYILIAIFLDEEGCFGLEKVNCLQTDLAEFLDQQSVYFIYNKI